MKVSILLLVVSSALALAADDFPTLMAKGDQLDAQLKTKEALATFLEAEKLQPNNAEVLHRIAKQLGESQNDTSDKSQKKAVGDKAMDYAKRAVAADPKNARAHLALAVCYGRQAAFVDNKTKIGYSKLTKAEVEKALELNPKDDLAWHVMGAWQYELANLNTILRAVAGLIYGTVPAASNEEAVRCFKKALELNPKRVGNHVELAKTYVAMGKKEEAKAEFQKGLALPDTMRDDPQVKAHAREALKKL